MLDFVAGRLAGDERASVERHLGHCLLCDRLVAVAAGHPSAAPANDVSAGDDDVERDGAALPLGTLLRDTYRLVRLIGRGGMGEVFEATHTRLPGRFAVKVLHAHCVADPKAIVRFRREAEITSGLRHPNIVAVVDFDYAPSGSPYIVMEYLDGVELAVLAAEEAPLALPRVLAIVDQIASALGAVHRRDIVHRDLKPQNIFLVRGELAGEEHVKLCDFGISKVRAASLALTGERVLLGTPQYMAPEQARGTGEVDARADQFALASIVYELLTGRLAFPGDRVDVVVYRITHDEPRPLGPPFGPALAATLARAFEKAPDARFPSVQDFAAALRAAAEVDRPYGAPELLSRTTLRNDPGAARPTSALTAAPPARAAAGGRRRALLGALGAAVVLAVVLATFATLAHSPRATPTAPETPARVAPAREPLFPPTTTPPPPSETPATPAATEGHTRPVVEAPRAKKTQAETRTVRDSKRGSLIDRL